MTDNLLEVSGLKKYFTIKKNHILKAVDNISFSIERGKTLGLVGESGCGKTTVGRTLMRIYKPDGGNIRFDGVDVTKAKQAQARNLTCKMQMVFQDPYASLNPFLTVGEIVSEGLEIHKLYPDRKQRQNRVYELLEMVGLNKDHANRFPHEFSGGQRQRVGIARALALNPEFIVCDEAISALDVSIQAQVVNMLMQFQREMGLTYLFIAHDLSMVRHIADQTAVMYLGIVAEYGNTDEIYTNPLHPYTQGLLAAVPVADPDYERTRKHVIISGDVISPVNPPPGCRFYSRCPKALDVCKTETPTLNEVSQGHSVACHNWNV